MEKQLRELLFVAYNAKGEPVAAFAHIADGEKFAAATGAEIRSRSDGYVYVPGA